jgi:hypothetical protein
MAGRAIRFDQECDKAAEALGGYEAIDDSLNAYLDALDREPAGFPKIETEWGSVRYIRTKPIGDIPELLWYFILDASGDVTLTHVEKYDPD